MGMGQNGSNLLSHGLQDLLRRNGMAASLAQDATGAFTLHVRGHDSPRLEYGVTAAQAAALAHWGPSGGDRKAYETFVSIVAGDFSVPKAYVYARNSGGRVNMGQRGAGPRHLPLGVHPGPHGAPGVPGHGVSGPWAWAPAGFLGYRPRPGMGYPVGFGPEGGRAVTRLAPGRLAPGDGGFYYIGGSRNAGMSPGRADALQGLEDLLPCPVVERPQGPATRLSDAVTSVGFTSGKFLEVLASHGMVVDADRKVLVVQSSGMETDVAYDISDEELGILAGNSLGETSLERRLALLNDIIKDDFDGEVTLDALDSERVLDLGPAPGAWPAREGSMGRQEAMDGRAPSALWPLGEPMERVHGPRPGREPLSSGFASVSGTDISLLGGGRAWYREGRNGREVEVGEIAVERVPTGGGGQDPASGTVPRGRDDGEQACAYRMTAVINGEAVSHGITRKQFDKFLGLDDYHRMRMFSRVFHEVDMKAVPGAAADTRCARALASESYDMMVQKHDGGHGLGL